MKFSPIETKLGARRVAKILEALREGQWPTDDEVIDAILAVPTHYLDLAITPTLVKKGTGAVTARGVFGETVTAGMALYKKATDTPPGRLWKAQCDTTDVEAAVVGIALNGGAVDQEAVYQSGGELTIGGTLVVGTDYFLSATAGGICVRSDLVATNRIVRLFRGKTAAIAAMDLQNYSLVVP